MENEEQKSISIADIKQLIFKRMKKKKSHDNQQDPIHPFMSQLQFPSNISSMIQNKFEVTTGIQIPPHFNANFVSSLETLVSYNQNRHRTSLGTLNIKKENMSIKIDFYSGGDLYLSRNARPQPNHLTTYIFVTVNTVKNQLYITNNDDFILLIDFGVRSLQYDKFVDGAGHYMRGIIAYVGYLDKNRKKEDNENWEPTPTIFIRCQDPFHMPKVLKNVTISFWTTNKTNNSKIYVEFESFKKQISSQQCLLMTNPKGMSYIYVYISFLFSFHLIRN